MIASTKDTSVNSNIIIDATVPYYRSYKVFDYDQNKWLENLWTIGKDAQKINGYKDYSYIHPYLIIDYLRFNTQDSIKKTCWALVIGYEGNSEAVIKEAYFVLDFEKHLASISNKIERNANNMEFAEFVVQDTFILYKIVNENQIYMDKRKGLIGNSIFPGGEFIEPYKDKYFILGQPKYKLIRKK